MSISGESIPSDFRCAACNSLFEIVYPWSSGLESSASSAVSLPNPAALRWLWQERRTSTQAIDQSGVWRFRDLLPIVRDMDHVTTLREGNTPLYDLPRAAKALGIHWILAKHQGMNPTGSFKDTGMTAALSVAVERGFQWVACASTGNTSAAMAAYAARAGLRSIVFIPEGKIAWGKLSQAMDYGALTLQLRTDFDGCVRMVNELVRSHPIYLLNSVNPYRLEGQKTPAFELLEQMDWQVPEHVIVPGGNLANSSALAKGFAEMLQLKLIGRVPQNLHHPGGGRESALPRDAGERRQGTGTDGRGDTRHGHSHRESGELAQSCRGAALHRGLVRTGVRSGDRAREGADWRRGHRLRASLGRYAGGAQEAGGGWAGWKRRTRGADPDRTHPEGF